MIFIKGIIIGIGKIIPGVSGSMLAISMGIYNDIISSVSDFLKKPKHSILFLLKLGIGILISIIFFSKIIAACLDKYFLCTMFLFIGLILGGVADIKKNIKKQNNFIIIGFFVLISFLGLININNTVNINNETLKFLYYILAGFVDAVTMVVPGISGTATLMMMGVYNEIILCLSNALNIKNILTNIEIIVPFLVGLIFGTIITVKIIEKLFKNFKDKTYCSILGFCMSTIFLMAIKSLNSKYTLFELIVGFGLLLFGFFCIKKINQNFSND